MGANFKPASRAVRGRRRARRALVSEVNVTPLVDVTLVLLIVFMVAAPMMSVGVPVDLPKTKASQLNSQTQPLTITIDKNGDVFLQKTAIDADNVVEKLKAIAKTGYNERIFLRADANAGYGTVMKIMARISAAGFHNIGLVTGQEKDK